MVSRGALALAQRDLAGTATVGFRRVLGAGASSMCAAPCRLGLGQVLWNRGLGTSIHAICR
jgi:hypothetical protein